MYTLPLLFFVRRRKVLADTDITSLLESQAGIIGWIAGALLLKYALVTCVV